MANKYLAREDAPFGSDVWGALDEAMLEAAKGVLVGRRILELEGPYGLGLKSVPLKDETTESGLIWSKPLPLVLLQEGFDVGARDLANYERQGLTLDRSAVAEAALAVARREDDLIFNGDEALGIAGLRTDEDVSRVALSGWDEVGAAADELIEAVTKLDEAGFHGPYALALAPARYNLLFRRYERGNVSEFEHVKTMITDGVYKAPVLPDGGVLLSTGRQYASVVVGQDMTVGFIGPEGDRVAFTISESLVPRVRRPGAICVLEG
ncbi:MAG: family 1 encapsulin nanocompartment shell protein [Chloroflexota bacterium]